MRTQNTLAQRRSTANAADTIHAVSAILSIFTFAVCLIALLAN